MIALNIENIDKIPAIACHYTLWHRYPSQMTEIGNVVYSYLKFYTSSTQNLQASLLVHLSDQETNPEIQKYIQKGDCFVEWTPDESIR